MFEINFQMNLVLHSGIPLETQLEIVESIFSEIPNREVWQFNHRQKPLDHHAGRILIFKFKIPHMIIVWQIPAMIKLRTEKPEQLIKYLLSHAGKGSLSNFLKRQGLATSFTFYSDNFRDYSINYLIVDLTREGVKKTSEIVAIVYRYMFKLRTMSPFQYVLYWVEHSKVLNINFDYFNHNGPAGTAK